MRALQVLVCIFLACASSSVAGPLSDAAKAGDLVQVEQLLSDGNDASEADGIATPIHWAAMNGHAEVITALADHGADMEAQSDMLGTPLHAAASRNQADAIAALLTAGADPDSRDRDQFTPLMQAAFDNRVEAATALVEGGADVNAIGNSPGGYVLYGPTTALHLALRKGNADIAVRLREAGAGPILPEISEVQLKQGDAKRGRELAYRHCKTCHALEPGDTVLATAGVGPPLIGVFGRPVADLGGFEYSQSLVDFGGDWTTERLYSFVLQPMLSVPGTNMTFAPDRTPEMIADIVAYLVSASE